MKNNEALLNTPLRGDVDSREFEGLLNELDKNGNGIFRGVFDALMNKGYNEAKSVLSKLAESGEIDEQNEFYILTEGALDLFLGLQLLSDEKSRADAMLYLRNTFDAFNIVRSRGVNSEYLNQFIAVLSLFLGEDAGVEEAELYSSHPTISAVFPMGKDLRLNIWLKTKDIDFSAVPETFFDFWEEKIEVREKKNGWTVEGKDTSVSVEYQKTAAPFLVKKYSKAGNS